MWLSNCFKIYYWPAFTSFWFILTFIISLTIAVASDHVVPYLPYISDTGSMSPESSIFGQMLNIGALFMGITMYIRYRQVELALACKAINLKPVWNSIAAYIGVIACIGMSIVANFQEVPPTTTPLHFLGAMMAFGIGFLYFLVQTPISHAFYKSSKIRAQYKIRLATLRLRMFLAFCLTPLFVAHVVCSRLAAKEFTGKTIIYWTKDNGGFELHTVAAYAEWILVMFMFIYILTFTNEFKAMEFVEVKCLWKAYGEEIESLIKISKTYSDKS